jgi:hypothetical protein
MAQTINKIHVWLIHGDTSSKPKSSFSNANALISRFSSDNVDVISKKISDINDPAESFSVVDGIYTF